MAMETPIQPVERIQLLQWLGDALIPPKVAWCFDAPRFVCQIPSNSLVKRSQWGRCLWLQSAKWLSLVIRSSDLVSRLHELQIDRQMDRQIDRQIYYYYKLLLLLHHIYLSISSIQLNLQFCYFHHIPSTISPTKSRVSGLFLFQGRWQGVQELLLQHDGGVQYRWESQGPEMSWFFLGLSRCEKLVVT